MVGMRKDVRLGDMLMMEFQIEMDYGVEQEDTGRTNFTEPHFLPSQSPGRQAHRCPVLSAAQKGYLYSEGSVDPRCNVELLKNTVPDIAQDAHEASAMGGGGDTPSLVPTDLPTDPMKSVFRILPFVAAKYDAEAKVQTAISKGMSEKNLERLKTQAWIFDPVAAP